jgi:nitroreductase
VAAFGVNRAQGHGRTAPSAHDWQEIAVYVADFAAMHDTRPDERPFLAGADAACIAQNVYLHCAAHGLGTVVRALIDRRQLAQSLGLKPTERIALAQSVGLPVLPLA